MSKLHCHELLIESCNTIYTVIIRLCAQISTSMAKGKCNQMKNAVPLRGVGCIGLLLSGVGQANFIPPKTTPLRSRDAPACRSICVSGYKMVSSWHYLTLTRILINRCSVAPVASGSLHTSCSPGNDGKRRSTLGTRSPTTVPPGA